jgi:mRNA interferase RelE/StbE
MPALQIKRAAEKDLKDLSADIRQRIIQAIQSIRDTPFPPGSQKLQGTESQYRLRVGDYRILYEFHSADQLAVVFRIKHRREAYR